MKTTIFKTSRTAFLFILCLFFTSIAVADYIAGEQANKKGDRVTAFKEFYAAANDKDIRAYGKLGGMYLYGLGTDKNYHQAYIWFEMSQLSGDKEGERFRDAASSMLSRNEYLNAVEAAEVQRIKLNLEK